MLGGGGLLMDVRGGKGLHVGDTPKHGTQLKKKGAEPASQADAGSATVSNASASSRTAAVAFSALALILLGRAGRRAKARGRGRRRDDNKRSKGCTRAA